LSGSLDSPALPESAVATSDRTDTKAPGHRRTKRRLPLWLAVIGWIVTVLLGVAALMRIFAWDDVEIFAVINAISALVYLPAWVVAIVAGIGRRYFLAAGALLVVVAQLFFVLPEITAAQPVPRWADTAPTIRLLDANVYYLNASSMAGYAHQIKAFRPQLVTMEEATQYNVSKLKKSGGLAALPHRFEISVGKSFFVASKYRLTNDHVVIFDGLPLIAQTIVHLPSGPQALWVVHTTAPYPVSFTEWKGQLALIAKLLRERGPHGLLVAGDFNATWGNKGFHAILDTGMTDGAAARGRAFDMTWSQTKRPFPPMVRIDHVLTGTGVAVTSIRTDVGSGSDHRDLLATVAVQKPFSKLLSPP
jgi:endonuclease/exonuclease/phosphatase (EEP) superfamily protein YafD